MRTRMMYLISAQLQSGKDVFGAALARASGAVTLALANPVKEVAIAMLGMPSAIAYGGEKERRAWKRYCKGRGTCPNETHDACTDAREWLQWIGTELGRAQVHEDVWVDRLFERAPAFSSSVVVTDARFKNELGLSDTLLKLNGNLSPPYKIVTIRIKRPGHENQLEHASEKEQTEIPDTSFDEVVVNSGTPQELESKAIRIATKYIAS